MPSLGRVTAAAFGTNTENERLGDGIGLLGLRGAWFSFVGESAGCLFRSVDSVNPMVFLLARRRCYL